MQEKHSWQFEFLDPKSQWIFVPVSEFAKSLGLYVRELGHFYQDGYCYTCRVPEDSFGLVFAPVAATAACTRAKICLEDLELSLQSKPGKTVTFYDNRKGYTLTQQGPSESYFIQFGGATAETYHRLFLQAAETADQRLFREIDWVPELIELFEDLANLYRQPPHETRDLYAHMRLVQTLTRLVLEDHSGPSLYVHSPYVTQALALIETQYAKNLTLAQLAQQLHLSSAYLSRLISKETGSSFSDCVNHVRLNQAKRLLSSSRLPLEAIAGACGFCNASHLIRAFRQSEGITPCAFRKRQASPNL